jgi:hypothetical protein
MSFLVESGGEDYVGAISYDREVPLAERSFRGRRSPEPTHSGCAAKSIRYLEPRLCTMASAFSTC